VDGQNETTDDTTRTVSKDSVNDNTTIQYINHRNSLTLSKTVEGDNANTNQTFTFKLTLKDSSGVALANKSYSIVSSAIDGVTAPTDKYTSLDSNGEAYLYLKHGQSVTIYDLPAGYQYTIEETGLDADESSYYDQLLFYEAKTLTVVDGTAGEYVSGSSVSGTTSATDADVQVQYVNTRSSLTFNIGLSKTVTGQFGDLNKAFTFNISLKDEKGDAVSGSFDVTTSSIEDVELPVIENNKLTFTEGQASVSLKHGQSIKILAIPEGYTYKIQEVMTSSDAAAYITSYKVNYENNVSTNKRRSGSLNLTTYSTDTGERNVERNETIVFTNDMQTIVPTGISTNVAQHAMFLMLMALLAGFVLTFRATRRRQH
jgi:fibronectin-binding protein 1